MIISLSVFGRGRSLLVHEYDLTSSRLVYFQWTKVRRREVVSQISIESDGWDGIQFRVMRSRRTQGWRLRGPVEHFEDAA